MRLILILVCLFVSGFDNLRSQEIAQWRGPQRNGNYPDSGLMDTWPENGPPVLWKVKGIGKGYSSAVSDGKRVYVTGMKDSTDYLTGIGMDGNQLWQVPIGHSWYGTFPDSRTTPTVEQERVYVIGGSGIVACIDAIHGTIIWNINGLERFEGKYGDWGVCESPLLVGDKLIYTPAGNRTTMVALDKMNGSTLWQTESLNDTGAYVSPILIRYADKNIIVSLIATYFFGVDADNGTILWKYPYATLLPEESLKVWPGAPKTNTITPLYDNGCIFITGGYDHPGAFFRLNQNATAVELVWTNTTLDCHHGGVVRIGGYIYGSNWIDNAKGNWCCIEWNTGKTMYENTWQTKGAIISADGRIYCFDERNGNIDLVNATPANFDLISSFKITEGKGPFWAHPVIAHGVLYVRHGDVLLAYDLNRR